MKKLFIGLFAVFAMGLTSCEEDTAFEANPDYIPTATGENPQGDGSTGGNNGGNNGGNGGNGGGNNEPTFLADSNNQNRTALLEDFTGVQCQWCPSGTKEAENMKGIFGDKFYVIGTHGGIFASPGGVFADFRTAFSSELINQAGVGGYPAGTMNRMKASADFGLTPPTAQTPGPLAMGRGGWMSAASDVTLMEAPVNIGAKATINGERELTVRVDLYYTAEEQGLNNINVALLQDHIISPQKDTANGGNSSVTVSDYEHNDVLRHYLTGQWGDEISEPKLLGDKISRTYTYTVPQLFKANTPNDEGKAVIDDLKIVVFVSRSRTEILNATGVSIEQL